jgi:hypothetical protein
MSFHRVYRWRTDRLFRLFLAISRRKRPRGSELDITINNSVRVPQMRSTQPVPLTLLSRLMGILADLTWKKAVFRSCVSRSHHRTLSYLTSWMRLEAFIFQGSDWQTVQVHVYDLVPNRRPSFLVVQHPRVCSNKHFRQPFRRAVGCSREIVRYRKWGSCTRTAES